MKQLIFASFFLLSTALGYAQQLELEQPEDVQAPADWKERFFELSREERFAVFDDESIDLKEVYELIETNRENNYFRKSAGGGDLFGCELWYNHDPLNDNTLDGTNWNLFSGGCGAGQGVDVYWGPVQMDWDFCFFGTTYNHFYINAKGTISFNEPMCDWTPEDFPGAGYNQIAGFWADFDFTATGLCYWELDANENAAIVTFVDVGYWPGANGLRNTMQMILTDGTSDILPEGYNVGLIYDDMQWAHGGVGGTAGFNGPTPAVVGADKGSGTNHVKIGRFNLEGSTYNGPYGAAGGVSWLDNKSFFLQLCDENGDAVTNHPPIPTYNNAALNGDWPSIACDTITVCLNDTLPFQVQYLGPENGQTVTVTYDDSGAPNFVLGSIQNGTVGSITGGFAGAPEFIGVHTLQVTATDNGTPVKSVTQTIVIEVLDFEAPQIEIIGDPVICQGQLAQLSVEPADLDYYVWSTGCSSPVPDCAIGYGGLHSVTAYLGECSTTEYVEVEVITFPLPAISYDPSPYACNDDCVEVCFQFPGNFVSTSWECYDEEDFECNFCSTDLNQNCVEVGPGTYVAIGLDDNGCEARNIFNIFEASASFPLYEDEAYCDGVESVEFSGGYSNPGGGNLLMYFSDADCAYGEGSFIQVTIWPEGESDPLEPQSFSMTNACFTANTNQQTIELNFGDSICVEYFASPEDNGNNSVQIFNCGGGNMVFNGAGEGGVLWCGMAACSADPATGVWEQNACPIDGVFGDDELFNTTFTPQIEGTYELTFTEDNCGQSHTFTLTFTEPLSNVFLTPGTDQVLCVGEEVDLELNYTAATECDVEVSWTNATQSNSDPAMATADFAGQYADETVTGTVTNGCGSVPVSIQVESQVVPNANLTDQTLCDGETLTLNPVDNDTPDLEYDWNNNAFDGQSDPVVTTSGTYSVTVSNDCGSDNASADVIIAQPYYTNWGDEALECDESSFTLYLVPALPDGYTAVWSPGGSTGDELTVTSSGTVTVTVADDAGCDTYVSSVDVTISSMPAISAVPSSGDTLVVCPNEVEVINLNPSGWASSYDWMLYCDGEIIELTAGESLNLSSDFFPQDCLESFLTLEGTATNQCGTAEAQWVVMASLCPVTSPNIFTPDEDSNGMNNNFELPGIFAYDHTELRVYDRWGRLVFESDDYQNNWRAEGVAEGTYWYIARLMDSTNEVVREITSDLTITRLK
ncbi:MAG: gliding motility-associated C-terminal domain-containing protein [Flavobacteriales bacterium]|nr:gliding motility-associated C-terminal domain-containing protein [Flavobacteriales bacterium]